MSRIKFRLGVNQEYATKVTVALDRFERGNGRHPELMAQKEVGEDPLGVYATVGKTLVGGVTFYIHNGWIFLLCGYVWPEWRNKGIYKKMLEILAVKAKLTGLSGIFASTYDWEAPKVYERLGFIRGAVLCNCPRGNTSIDYYKEV